MIMKSVVAALLGASLGAMAGAVAGERWKGRTLDESMEVGNAAFWGRLLGTMGKTLLGGVMIAWVIGAFLV